MSILKIKDSQGNWVGVPTVKGDKGNTGNGISSAILNDDYTLTLTFTDGTTYKTPSIRGEKGEKGEPATDMEIHICSASEYDAETRIPTIANPNDKTFYLVPTEDGTSPDLFTEWVYVNNAWEMFGSMKIDLSGYLTDVQINGESVVQNGIANIDLTGIDQNADDITDLKEDLTQADNALNDAFGVSSLLDDVAFDGKTYREIFEDNNLLPFGDFENGLGWIKTNTNGAVITPEDYCSKSHSLKCFGTSSVQIRKDLSYASTIDVAILCKVKVTRYVSGGGAGFVFSSNHLINHVTDGYETIYSRKKLTTSVASLFVGTVSSANCDAYIDDVRIINLTALFNPVGAIEAKLKTAYDEYIERRNKEYNRRKTEAKSLQVGNPVYIGAVIGASGEEQRFKAMHELLDIAEYASKNPDVAQAKIESVFSDASSGAIIHMPYGNCALYRGANITPIFSKNADVQYIPASTTKVMSVITGLDYLQNLNEVITIKQGDIQAGSGNVFNAGDTLTIKDLLYAMMLQSSNTAAQAFARVCGAKILAVTSNETPTDQQCYDAFINAMNKKAALLGMSNSEFVSASGASSSNKTTANDMIKMMVEACTFSELLKIWGADSYTIAVGGDNARSVTVDTTVTNDALETYYKILGGKTGAYYIDASTYGYALVMVAQAK